ncbi:MAG: DUF3465 domain-containing protein [Kiritimatiellae bacterium]|nr:DUF3465 domain-containing protein [Kiritimatiellia bacterium]
MNDETNGAIDLKDVRKLARGASTLKKLTTLFGRKTARKSVPRAAAKKARTTRSAKSAKTVEVPWFFLLFCVLAVVVWWLADGGAKVCADTFRRLQNPAPAETAAPSEKPAKAKSAKKTASAAPASPEVLTDGLWWEGRGIVEKVLPDDTTPPCHQRFFLRDDRGRSLFFAHNVDEAPRVPDLREGDEISFRGEWRDNEMGGAMHWTHRAGTGRRKGGWLERDGVRYE